MARIRSIKPQFFRHGDLFDAEKASCLPLRVAYAGLWCVADRHGRFKWKPREIKVEVLPYDDVDFGAVLDALAHYRFVFKYQSGGEWFGYIPKFSEHQHINKHEPESSIPAPPKDVAKKVHARAMPVHAPREGNDSGNDDGNGKEGKESCAEPQAAPAPEAPPVELLPTNREGEEVGVSQAQVDEFTRLYPAVDVRQELRAMRGWLLTNERKRKTRKGMGAFINSWLSKEQNRAGQTRTNGGKRGPTRVDNSVAGARRFLGEDEGSPRQNPASDPQPAGSATQHRALPPPAAVASDHARGFSPATAQAGCDFPRPEHEPRPDDLEIPSFLRRS